MKTVNPNVDWQQVKWWACPENSFLWQASQQNSVLKGVVVNVTWSRGQKEI